MNLNETTITPATILVLAASVLLHAWTVWRSSRRQRPRDLASTLEAHSAEIAKLLETETGRRALARFVVHETALQGFITETQDEAVTAAEPLVAAETKAKRFGRVEEFFRKAGAIVKPLGETLLGKVNSYIKSQFGLSIAD